MVTPFQLNEEPPPRRVRGFFEELLATRPEALLEDAQENPDAYDPDTLEVLMQLFANRRAFTELTPGERKKLDEATMEFYSATPRTKVPINARSNEHGSVRAPGAPEHARPIEGPVVDSFWWT